MKVHSRGWLAIICTYSLLNLLSVTGSKADQTDPDSTSFKPLKAPNQTANIVRLTALEQLGKNIFFDRTLSSPQGYSCATCHVPSTGFTGPSSPVNEFSGPMPGVIPGRFGHRKPQAVAYAAFSPEGPHYDADLQVYLGGNFWDGRAPDEAAQARMPFLDPDEMANTSTGPLPPHAGGFSPLVAQKLKQRPYAIFFPLVFGPKVFFTASSEDLYDLATYAIQAYEHSAEVNQFSSKYDASVFGVPSRNHYHLTASEENGRVLFFDKAQCFACHSSASLDPVLQVTGGKDTFTMYCFANIGVPPNPQNPFYAETNSLTNPDGFNPFGEDFIDFGLGGNPNPGTDNTLFYNDTPGDIAAFRGLFKAPSLRNVDARPSPKFVKAYMHNGVFKSLEEVVHFYNKRNIAVGTNGDEVVFDLRVGPPSGYTPLFAPPEVLDNVQNAAGVAPGDAGDDVDNNGQVGNLGLTPQEETDIVNFLKTLTDGYTKPNPVGN